MQKYPFNRSTIILLLLASLMQVQATSAIAQQAFTTDAPDSTLTEDHMPGMILIGTGMGTLGFLAGGLVGASAGNGTTEYAGLEKALVLGSIVGGITLPLGVHYGNKSRGNLGAAVATSLVVGGAGWLIIQKSGSGAILPAIPLFQLIGCIAVESATTASKPPDQQHSEIGKNLQPPILINLVPTDGGMGLFFSGSF